MPQIQLPIFPEGVSLINSQLAFALKDGCVTYLHGHLPVFSHSENDLRTFRMITSQFYLNGLATQAEIFRAFGVPPISVKRAVKLYREKGPEGFYAVPRRRGAAVLRPPVLAQVQQALDEGQSVNEIAAHLGLKPNTLAKAIRDGRLHRPESPAPMPSGGESQASSKSERSEQDSQAPMGMAATNTLDRVAASLGLLGAVGVKFDSTLDVPNGGVLFALPALMVSGLLRHAEKHFQLPRGYYGLESLFLLLAFMALARIASVERLRYCAPGEWGKLLGLDRIPEVRTLREKIAHLSRHGKPAQWSAQLCADWMEDHPDSAMALYVDGHVRVYHGRQTKLPRHYVARQRLCLRATTDYWVNAMDGQPFFVVHKEVDPGLIQVLEKDLVPRLLKEVPNQPTPQQLEDDALRHRFTLIYDRAGYSPALILRMKKQRIACLSYHKHPGEDWSEEEFHRREVCLASGQVIELRLAERGTFLGKKLWVREIRKLTEGGHQTSMLATDYRSELEPIAATMLARWSQENFFKYMREHYGLDRLVDYGTEEIPETTRVVNPEHRRLDNQVRRQAERLNRHLAKFGGMSLDTEIEPPNVEAYQQKKAQLQEEISHLRQDLNKLKEQRKAVDRHTTVANLPEEERFDRLSTQSKHLIDTIKMIAYRAETAMAHVLRERMTRHDDARSLLRGIYSAEADLVPDQEQGTLTVRLHHLANRSADEAVRHLCDELNATETTYPGTDLRLVYDLVSSQNPRDQEV